MKRLFYILFLFGFISNAQVNVWDYNEIINGGNNNGTIEQSELQTAIDNETNLIVDPLTTITISSSILINKNMINTIDFNGSTITRNSLVHWMLNIKKRNYANTLTTITDLILDGNNQGGSGVDVDCRVHMTNVEIKDINYNGANGVRILTYDDPGIYGQSVYDNVDIHNLETVSNNGSAGDDIGMVHGFLVSAQEEPSQTTQIVYKNSDLYELWGEDAGGITVNSPGKDTSDGPLSLWFENITVADAQRRTVKNFIGNTTWINSTFTSAAADNVNLVPAVPGPGLNPAGLFVVAAGSSATGATNNLICGCTFQGHPSDPFDSWYTQVIMWGQNGPTSMELRNSTLTGGHGGNWGANGFTVITGQSEDLTIANTTFGTTNTIKALGTITGTFNLDSGNTYADGKATALAPTTMAYTESAIAYEACPTIGGTPETNVTSVTTYPTDDKLLVAGTRQLYEFVLPIGADDITGVWSSDDEGVATVSASGLVTAQGTGSCIITWTANDTTNGTITDTSSITVESSSTEDAIMILQPQGYFTPSSGDSNSWDDTSGFEMHGTEVGTITFTDEASFDGSSYYDLPDSPFLDYRPTLDEFTIIYREGDTAPTTQGYALSKRTITLEQYAAMAYLGGNIERFYAGGSNEAPIDPVALNDNRLVVVVFQTGQVDVWVDGVHEITASTAIGSELAPGQSANIGGRTDGGYLMNNGATLDIVATIPKAISEAEREAIETEFMVNGAPPSEDNSTKPTGALGEPVYFLGTTKKLLNPNG